MPRADTCFLWADGSNRLLRAQEVKLWKPVNLIKVVAPVLEWWAAEEARFKDYWASHKFLNEAFGEQWVCLPWAAAGHFMFVWLTILADSTSPPPCQVLVEMHNGLSWLNTANGFFQWGMDTVNLGIGPFPCWPMPEFSRVTRAKNRYVPRHATQWSSACGVGRSSANKFHWLERNFEEWENMSIKRVVWSQLRSRRGCTATVIAVARTTSAWPTANSVSGAPYEVWLHKHMNADLVGFSEHYAARCSCVLCFLNSINCVFSLSSPSRQ